MPGITATYVDADTFTVATDMTLAFIEGRRVKCDCGVDGDKFGTVESSSYGALTTTVNLASTNDDITSNLVAVWFGIVKPGTEGSIPEHPHDNDEGSGGSVSDSVFYADSTETDQGAAGNGQTIKTFVDAIGSDSATIYLRHDSGSATTTYTVTTSETIPSNITLEREHGAIIDGAGTLTISGPLKTDLSQAFGTSITILFGVNSTTEIHPEWWGTFPNGSNDTTILNKAIAAADLVGTFDGYADASIIVRPGRYYIAHSSLSTIKTNFIAPNSLFKAITNTTREGYLLRFDFSEAETFKTIDIGTIFGHDVISDVNHNNVGITLLGGGNVRARVGSLMGLYMGILSGGTSHQEHISQWNFDISTILGCDYGIYAAPGTTTNSEFETNSFNIDWVAYTNIAVALDGSAVGSKNCVSNRFTIGVMELHYFDGHTGFWLSGEKAFGNNFVVNGGLVRPTGAGRIVYLLNDTNENIFELSHVDWALISATDAGYNIFRETSNHNASSPSLGITNDVGRSEVNSTAAPTTLIWRKGDRAWNSSPNGGGVLGWICVTSGSPGTWVPIGGDMGGIGTLADEDTPTVADGTKFLTGGTTTITDFDDGVTGQEIKIVSEHAITITDGTNIFLNGSANFVMADTDTLTLICKADNKWYELARSDNT